MLTLNQQLRAARKAAKLTQEQLAERAGVGLRTLCKLELGGNVELSVLAAVAKALGGRLLWRKDR